MVKKESKPQNAEVAKLLKKISDLEKIIAQSQKTEELLKKTQQDLNIRNESLAAINTVSDRIHRSLDYNTVIQEAIAAMVRYGKTPTATMFEYYEDLNCFVLLDSSEKFKGTESERLVQKLFIGKSLAGEAYLKKSIVICEDIATDDRIKPEIREALIKEGKKSSLSIPLLFQNHAYGVMNLIFSKKLIFTNSELETLLSISKIIGLAIANARNIEKIKAEIEERKKVHEAMEQSIASLKTVNTVADRIYRSFDYKTLLKEAIAAMIQYGKTPTVVMFEYNELEKCLFMIDYSDSIKGNESVDLTRKLYLDKSVAGRAVLEKKIIFCPDIAKDEHILPATKKALLKEGRKSVVCIPLLFRNHVLGVMNLLFPQKYTFADYEIETLLSIGKTIGLAMANARNIEKIKAEIEEKKKTHEAMEQSIASLKAINTVADRIYRSLDYNTVIQEAIATMVHYGKTSTASMYEYHEDLNCFVLLDSSDKLKGTESVRLAQKLFIGKSLAGEAYLKKSIVICEDIATDDRITPEIREALIKEGKKSALSIPLLFQNHVHGIMNLIFSEKFSFNDYELETLLSIGKTIGLAIANALHIQQIKADVEERKIAQEVLRQSEEKHRTILENIEDGYYEVDLNGNFTFFNDSMCRILGYPQEETMGMNNRQFTDKENAKKLFKTSNEVYRTGKPAKEFGWQIIRKDGAKRYIEVSVSLQKNSSGKPIGFRGIARDITERKQADETLRQSEEHYRSIIETIEDGYYEVDLKGNFINFNEASLKLFHCSKEELMGASFKDFSSAEFWPQLFTQYNKVYETGIPARGIELSRISEDGAKIFGEISVSLIRDEKGTPIGFRGIGRDITDKKTREEALRESEEKYRNILENIEDGYYEVDFAGNLTFFNDSMCQIWGYPKEELMGMNNRQYTDKENAKKLFQAFNEVYRTGKPAKGFDWQIIRKDGTYIYIEASVSLRKDSSGKNIGFRGITRDVTKRKRAEEELLRSKEKYRSLVENAQESIYQSTAEGRHLALNPAFARLLGYDSPQEVMQTITDIAQQLYVNPDDRKKLIQLVDEKGSVTDFETEFYKKDGSRIWVSVNMHAVRDEEGRLLYYQGLNQDITEKKKIEVERRENIERLRKSLNATINAMAATVETRDPYTAGHQRRVADLARTIAVEMNLKSEQIDGVRMASMIHDIGKISIPADILTKPTHLTNLEFNLIKTHSESGYNILKDIEFPWPVARIVLEHHERINGSGYPNGLKGEQTLLESKILAVADVVEAISSHRPYRPAHGIEVALDEITKNKGILYEPDIVDACLRLFREKNYNLAAL